MPIRHPTGNLTYSVVDLCFDIEAFERFSQELRHVQQGKRRDAALRNVGDMMVLRGEREPQNFIVTFNIREYLAPTMTTLNAKIEVDYDLFVNRLPGDAERFVDEIRLIEPAKLS